MLKQLLFTFLLLGGMHECVQALSVDDHDFEVAEQFRKLLVNYDKRMRPNYMGNITTVDVDIAILSFGAISELKMTFLLDIFLRQKWIDYRLRHNMTNKIIPLLGRNTPPDFIWTPDTHFINAIKAIKHTVTVSNEKLDIYPDGTVFWGTRVTLVATCDMDFKTYPMDIQTCGIALESYAYTEEHVRYRWFQKGLSIVSPEISQYTLVNFSKSAHLTKYLSSGVYSILEGTFVFQRRMAVSLMQIFFPSTAIVCISFVSFWVHKNCVSARVGLGIIPLLTISTIWGSVNRSLPRVNYVKAIDVYFIGSFCFIFCALLEYTVVQNLNFKAKKKKSLTIKRQSSFRGKEGRADSAPLFNDMFTGSCRKPVPPQSVFKIKENVTKTELDNRGRYIAYTYTKEADKKKPSPPKLDRDKMPYYYKAYRVQGKPTTLDVICRFFFPFSYFCFNMVFWVSYHMTHHTTSKLLDGPH
ncbi:glycine receptor subunit alpha-2-like [Hydractinia symbiolongicarpus]|uniref:glycine receptor subunit alpha-2-like n=1 Tax=Hydractinia symbiolongicarpus TaxID=13093 RepID=UPI00254B419F|nr:glycine receptor subunit alpha-2-like [Hydractinia symbiolongicarpus]